MWKSEEIDGNYVIEYTVLNKVKLWIEEVEGFFFLWSEELKRNMLYN